MDAGLPAIEVWRQSLQVIALVILVRHFEVTRVPTCPNRCGLCCRAARTQKPKSYDFGYDQGGIVTKLHVAKLRW